MFEKCLTTFNRSNFLEKADFFEKTGNFCLGLLHTGCGKTWRVAVIQKEGANKIAFTEKMYSTNVKIAVIALSILMLPITIVLAGIGCIAMTCSKSHQHTFQLFNQTESSTEKTNPKNTENEDSNSLELGKYVIPARRIAFVQTRPIPQENIVFEDDEIIGTPHAMKFLPSPFPREMEFHQAKLDIQNLSCTEAQKFKMFENLKLAEQSCKEALAITTTGKHVMIQQMGTTCGPTCVAMLILDRQGIPNYGEIIEWADASPYALMESKKVRFKHFESLLREAGFSSRLKKPKLSDSPEDNISQLRQYLIEYGPGLLSILPEEGGYDRHVIILDEISIEENRATIRDPQHGWQIDITLDALKKKKPRDFLQITSSGDAPIKV